MKLVAALSVLQRLRLKFLCFLLRLSWPLGVIIDFAFALESTENANKSLEKVLDFFHQQCT